MNNKVFLVGAGPGDKGLITKKGIECIEKADVIIYDRLVNIELLDYRKNGSELFYVGKQSSNHVLPQDEINSLIVKSAKEGKTVVRLKGGDPYVFGRGGEEAEILFDEGIKFEIVPGVTSAIGGLAYAGIPVTHRDFASSFHVVTGHAKKDDSLEINWKALAEEKGTVIFLMGIGNIKHITKMLIDNGRNPNTPVAFVSWATRYNQRTIKSTLSEAYNCTKENNIQAPAIFVVGGVVGLTDKLSFFESKPLFGKSIVVTRTRKKNSELRIKLEDLGARVIELPTIQVELSKDADERFDSIISNIESSKYTHIAFTSHNTVDYFFKLMSTKQIDARKLANIKICSIGPATSSELKKHGIYPDLQADKFDGTSLANKIVSCIEDKENSNVLLPCSEIATSNFENILKENSVGVERFEIYSNRPNFEIKERIINILKDEVIDYITFTSSSTFNNLVDIIGEENLTYFEKINVVSIGEITSESIKSKNVKIDLISENATIGSMVDAILNNERRNM